MLGFASLSPGALAASAPALGARPGVRAAEPDLRGSGPATSAFCSTSSACCAVESCTPVFLRSRSAATLSAAAAMRSAALWARRDVVAARAVLVTTAAVWPMEVDVESARSFSTTRPRRSSRTSPITSGRVDGFSCADLSSHSMLTPGSLNIRVWTIWMISASPERASGGQYTWSLLKVL
jgi:hypothetical protein